MTLLHIIKIAGEAVFFYALWMFLMAVTFVLMDLFNDWYSDFKESRNNKDAENNQGGAAK